MEVHRETGFSDRGVSVHSELHGSPSCKGLLCSQVNYKRQCILFMYKESMSYVHDCICVIELSVLSWCSSIFQILEKGPSQRHMCSGVHLNRAP